MCFRSFVFVSFNITYMGHDQSRNAKTKQPSSIKGHKATAIALPESSKE